MTKHEWFFDEKKIVKITKRPHAFEDFASSYNVENLNTFKPELQLKVTQPAIKNKLKNLLSKSKGFKFVAILALEFKKMKSNEKELHNTIYSNSKAEKFINESDIYDELESIYSAVI